MIVFHLFNFLFHWSYPIYKPLYFAYKRYSDRTRIAFIKDHINPGDFVLDIGANIGFYTCLFSHLVGPNGKVVAFEPDEVNFKRLSANVQGLNNVELHNSAAGESNETIKLYYSDKLNVDHQTYDIGEDRGAVDIESVRIDDVIDINEKITFIKIDIQGYDYKAMKGMNRILSKSAPISILGEYWPYGIDKAGDPPLDYLNYLEELDFVVEILDGLSKGELNEKIEVKGYYTDFKASKSIAI